MRALGGVALALLLAGCIEESSEETNPGIRETGYLTCLAGGEACGAQWSCRDAEGTEVCVEPADGCGAPTCACAGEALCGSRACRDVEGGVACGDAPGPDAAVPPDTGPLTPDGALPDAGEPEGDWYLRPARWNARITVRGGAHGGLSDRRRLQFQVVRSDGRPVESPVTVRFEPSDVEGADIALGATEATTGENGVCHLDVLGGTRAGTRGVRVLLRTPEGEVRIATGRVEVLAGPPSAAQLRLSCADPVLPAFLAGGEFAAEPPSTPCQALLADRFGNLVADAQVDFWTEAGDVLRLELPEPPGLTTWGLFAQAPPPVDVAPAGPSPGDGLVTVTAVIRGEERFTDLDGNGVFDEGVDRFDPEDDLPEPYVDANGNGTWDASERFGDPNGNEAWDGPDGVWNGDAEIWAATTVLWVGPRVEAAGEVTLTCDGLCTLAPPECPGADFRLEPGGSVTAAVRFADANGNCIGGDEGALTFASTHPDVSALEVAIPLGQTCFTDGVPGARTVDGTITDLGPAAADRELYTVEVVATYRRADGENERVVRTLTGCR